MRMFTLEFADENLKYEVNESIFVGGICQDRKAFNFLKSKKLIDIGICPKCGNEPIPNDFLFSMPVPRQDISFFICSECYGNRPKKGCYIATVCYGNEYSMEVLTLKGYRDNVLLKSSIGRLFVKFYYLVSPSISKYLVNQKHLNILIKVILLNPVVRQLKKKNNL